MQANRLGKLDLR